MAGRRDPASEAPAPPAAGGRAAAPSPASPPAPSCGAETSRPRLAWQVLMAVVLLALLWTLREALIVGFGAVLMGAALLAGARPLSRASGLVRRWSVLLLVLAVALVLVGVFWAVGEPLGEQLRALRAELPKAWTALKAWLGRQAFGPPLLDWLGDPQEMKLPWGGLAGVATGTLRALSTAVLILLMGVYLAMDVSLYRAGLLRLFPVHRRPAVSGALDEAGEALTRWLLGQAVMMVAIGVITAVGLSLLGIRMAVALGLIAGLLEFVPFFGPVVAGLLAVLVAFAQGPQAALSVALLVLAIQQLENHLLMPLTQRWAVALPPVLGLGSVLVFGTLFGLPGVVFGTPLMVLAMVLVRRLYVEPLEAQAQSQAGTAPPR